MELIKISNLIGLGFVGLVLLIGVIITIGLSICTAKEKDDRWWVPLIFTPIFGIPLVMLILDLIDLLTTDGL